MNGGADDSEYTEEELEELGEGEEGKCKVSSQSPIMDTPRLGSVLPLPMRVRACVPAAA